MMCDTISYAVGHTPMVRVYNITRVENRDELAHAPGERDLLRLARYD